MTKDDYDEVAMTGDEIMRLAREFAKIANVYDPATNSSDGATTIGKLTMVLAFMIASIPGSYGDMVETRDSVIEEIERISDDVHGNAFQAEYVRDNN